MLRTHLIILCDALVAFGAMKSHWAVGMACVGSYKFFKDMKDGRYGSGKKAGCSLESYERAMQWFTDYWPADLPWPADVPRFPKNPQQG